MKIPFDEKARLGYVWLVWGFTPERSDLIAIATTEEARERYLETGKRMGRYKLVDSERAFVDHLYGDGMLQAVTNMRMRRP